MTDHLNRPTFPALGITPKQGAGSWLHDGCHHDTAQAALWCGVLNFCGCGRPESAASLLLTVLQRSGAMHDEKQVLEFPDDPGRCLAEHVADDKGLPEHGGMIGSAWLTDKGREALTILGGGPDEW